MTGPPRPALATRGPVTMFKCNLTKKVNIVAIVVWTHLEKLEKKNNIPASFSRAQPDKLFYKR